MVSSAWQPRHATVGAAESTGRMQKRELSACGAMASCMCPECCNGGRCGAGPSITAGLVVQLLTGSKIIEVNTSLPEDRRLM